MELSNIIAALCLAVTIPQGIVAFKQLAEMVQRGQGVTMQTAVKPNSLTLAILLLFGTVITIGGASWVFFTKPFRPVDRLVYVDKAIPCPPSKTGDVDQHGNGNAANSGNGGEAVAGQPLATPKKHK